MSLRLKKRESVSTGLRRLIRERLAMALRELNRGPADMDAAVHNARKRLKESRAVLRLLRPALPEAVYQLEKCVYRDSARPLSELRDTRILMDALDRLAATPPEAPLDVSGPRRELEARRGRLLAELSDHTLNALKTAIAASMGRLDDWPVSPHEWRTIRDGLRAVYRRGRRCLSVSLAEPTDEHLHEWRKASKMLWYQLQVLEGVWPGLFEPLAEQVHQLTNLLGDDHDLAVLAGLVGANGATGLPPASREGLLARLEERRSDFQREAFRLGQRIYAEKPASFVRRIGEYWRTWRDTDGAACAVEGAKALEGGSG